MNIKELSYVIRTTFGAPLDVRYSISSLSELNEELPQPLRYDGQLVYIRDNSTLYIFRGGTSEDNFIPFCETDIKTVDSISEITDITPDFQGQLFFSKDSKSYFIKDGSNVVPMPSSSCRVVKDYSDIRTIPVGARYIGQAVWVVSEKRRYAFKNGVADSDLVPDGNSHYISSLQKLADELPEHSRKPGDYVWVGDTSHLRVVDINRKLIKVDSEIKSFINDAELSEITNSDYHPYIVVNTAIGATYVWSDSHGRYININTNSVISADTVDEMLTKLSSNVEDMERIEGKLYYIRELGEHYTFIGGISNSNFKSIRANYVIDTITDLASAIPSNRRYVGQQFYVVDEALWYYFKDDTVYQKMNGFNRFSIELQIPAGDYEYIHNRNISSVLMSIKNSRGELVDMPWCQGYANTKNKTPQEILYAERNIITLSTDVPDKYTLTLLTV